MGLSRRATTTVVVLVIAVGQADTAASQDRIPGSVVVAGGAPGPTLEVADATDDGFDRLALTLGLPG